ncbi:prolyl oligopeptidase [Zopfochytrium polystomum]|nr:prolyl oligopeptidase [Zopfochytrium polystomum]
MGPWAYPAVARDETVKDTYHGKHVVPDPYRALEDPDAAATKAFVQAQNSLFHGHLSAPGSCKAALKARLTDVFNYERFGCPFKRGEYYYYFHNSGLQPQSVLYRKRALDGPAEVFFDPNTLSDDGTVSLNTYSFTESGSRFAYALSASGSDWVRIFVRDTAAVDGAGGAKDLEDPIEWVKFTGISWTRDEKGFFYNRFPKPAGLTTEEMGRETDVSKNQMVMYHRMGTSQSEDILCYSEPDNPDRMFGTSVTDDGQYLVLTISESCDPKNLLYVCDLKAQYAGATLDAAPKFVKVVSEWKAEFSYLANNGTVFYLETTLDAPRRKIVKYDLTKPELGFVDVVAQADDVLSMSTVVNENKMVLIYLRDVKHVIKLFDLDSGAPLAPFELPLPTGSIVKSITGRREDSESFYYFASFLSPGVIYRYDFSTMTQSLFLETKVKGYDSTQFQTEQVFYSSADGTKIPMFITSRKGTARDGNNPTLLYAYGGFNISVLPTFSVTWLTFIEKFNGVVAVANIRGGSEYGEDWYNGGRLEKKQNCFTDFQEAAKYLCREGYTSPKKLAINGGSNGGLLVAACVNQAPELFGCAVADVGVMDLLRFKFFTIGAAWTSDYGDVEATEAEFLNALKLSPLHNVRTDGTPYPAVLLTTAERDDRVVPLHSLKLIATLQHLLPNNPNPLMIRVETKAGHGAGKSTAQMIEEASDKYAFIASVS